MEDVVPKLLERRQKLDVVVAWRMYMYIDSALK
jgi:hypothetical protein